MKTTALILTTVVVAGATVFGQEGLPKLIDIGAKTCIPCKKMAPILEELKKEHSDRLVVQFIDVSVKENVATAKKYGIKLIPTQIFLDKNGKELWRHEGFLGKEAILAKWTELGLDLQKFEKIERWSPAKKDTRKKDRICYMCDGDVTSGSRVVVKTEKGDVNLCSMHCYFIMYSCLTEDKTDFEKRVSVTAADSRQLVPALSATFLVAMDEKDGRPKIHAYANRAAATKAMQTVGGSIVSFPALRKNELSHRCGFCDRSCYPQDAAEVLIEGVHSYGCCAHCAMGIAARTGKDIEVRQPDGLTGEIIVVKTLNGQIASIDPPTAVAWFGKKKKAGGSWGSAGCFHQGFFTKPEHLKKWLELHPFETGQMITIAKSLADKMKLTPQQIHKACKIGQCSPK